jgi:hypothetical protein
MVPTGLEVLRPENSGIRQGKTYRIYAPAEVLRRRSEAGYLWVLRNRSAVELVKVSSLQQSAPVVSTGESILTTVANLRRQLDEIATCGMFDEQASEEETLEGRVKS